MYLVGVCGQCGDPNVFNGYVSQWTTPTNSGWYPRCNHQNGIPTADQTVRVNWLATGYWP